MDNENIKLIAANLDLVTKKEFKVVLVYGDLATGKRGKEFCEEVYQHLGKNCLTKSYIWNFNELINPFVRKTAAKYTSAVDMIVIAARGEEDLPTSVRRWIKMWGSQKRDSRCVLVGILSLRNKPYDKLPSTSSYLHKAARKAEMPFFWEPIYPSKNHFNFSKDPFPLKITNADREIDVTNSPTDNFL